MAKLNPENLMLLDWFAGCVAMGLAVNSSVPYGDIAETAFDIANDMLIEREKRIREDKDESEEPSP